MFCSLLGRALQTQTLATLYTIAFSNLVCLYSQALDIPEEVADIQQYIFTGYKWNATDFEFESEAIKGVKDPQVYIELDYYLVFKGFCIILLTLLIPALFSCVGVYLYCWYLDRNHRRFMEAQSDCPDDVSETDEIPISLFMHHYLYFKTYLDPFIKFYYDKRDFIVFILKYVLYEICNLSVKNFVSFVLNPFGMLFIVFLNLLYITSHTIFSFCSFIILTCIIYYYYRSVQALRGMATVLTKHQSVEVFGLPQPFVKLIFNMYFFYNNVKGSTNSSVWLRNCAQFLMSYHDVLQVNFVLSSIFSLDIEAQSGEDYINKAQDLLDNWESLRSSDLVAKTNRVFRALVFAGCVGATGQKFSSDGMKEMLDSTNYGKYKFTSTEDMVFSITQLVVLYCKTGHECFVDESLRPLFVKNRTVRSLMKEYDDLMITYANLPVTKTDICNKLLEESRGFIARSAALSKMEPSLIGPMRRSILDKYTKLMKEHNVSSIRKPPFSVLLYGSPGIGKSYLTQRLAAYYQRIVTKHGFHDVTFNPFENIYTYNSSDEYFSGYKGAQQWCMVLDDLGRETQFMVKSGKTKYLNDLFTIVNTVGVATNQAALEDKGVIPLIPKLVVATSNTKDLHAHLGVSEPTALLRRLPYIIEPVLKDEYLDKVTGTMKQCDHTVDNAWYFFIDTYKITKCAQGRLVGTYVRYRPREGEDGDQCTIQEMFGFLSDKIQKHETSSNMMMEGMKSHNTFDICEHDIPKCYTCEKCSQLVSQSFTDWIPSWSSSPTRLTLSQWYMYRMLECCYDHHQEYLDSLIGYLLQFEDGKAAVKAFFFDHMDKQCPGICQTMRRLSIVFGACLGAYAVHSAITSLFNMFKSSGNNMESQGNFWFQPEKSLFTPPKMLKPNNEHEIMSSLKKSLFRLSVQEDGKGKEYIIAFCLSDGRYLTVGHPFREGSSWKCEADFGETKCRVNSTQQFVLHRNQCDLLPNDLCVFKACLLPRKHLVSFLPEEVDTTPRSCLIVGLNASGGLVKKIFRGVNYQPIDYKHRNSYIHVKGMVGELQEGSTSKGECGSIYLSEIRGGYCITGIHVAGKPNTTTCASSQISRKLFEQLGDNMLAMSELGDSLTFSGGNRSSGPLGIPSTKGVHHWCDSFGVLKGSFGHGVTPKSHVVKTDICDELCVLMNYTLPFAAPVMKPFQRDGIWFNPYTLACDVQGQVSPYFESGDVLYIATSMVEETTKDSKWLEDIRNVPLNVAINGEHGNTYINSLPMSTSGGFLYPGSKRKYFLGEVGEYEFEPRLLKDYKDVKNSFALNQTAGILFNGTLKDEPRKIKKVLSGETRVFTASDVVFSVIVREQYLDVCSRIQQHNFVSECAVSMNHGTQWNDIYNYICKFGEDRIIAGDYKNYDKRMPAVFIRAAFYVLDSWRSVTRPLDKESINISRSIATELSFPHTSLNRDVVQFFGGNSSGHPLTAILNSIANSLFMRYAYWKLGFDPVTFKRHVSLMTLGDDNIMGSSLNDFNHVNISKVLGQHSVIYTMAQKEAKSVPFIHIDEADFLKRKFREVRGDIMGPIEEDSIMKSLCLWQDKGNISQSERLSQCYLDARREWSLHGEDVFKEKCAIMENLFDTPKYKHIRLFFIQRHKYSWETTVDWIKGKLSSDDGDDDLIYAVDKSMEAQSSANGDSFEKEFGVNGSDNLYQISRRSGTQHSLLGVVVNPSQYSEYSSRCSVLCNNRNLVACMAYSVMDFLYDTQIMVNHKPPSAFTSSTFEAQSENEAPTTSTVHAPSAMNSHDYSLGKSPKIVNLGDSHKADIHDFFSRKVQIAQYDWDVGTVFNVEALPWSLLFDNPQLRDKLNNYNLIKGKLMLTFYINGTPFHTGMLLASYRYMNIENNALDPVLDTHLITRSQRPHVYLNASTCKSGCLCIPFFWPNNYYGSVTPATQAALLGSFCIDSFTPLRQVSAGSDTIEITVFAQLIDPIITGPTPNAFNNDLVAQSDEYGSDGPVSAPATAVANIAAALESVPVISPFATATKIGASAIGSIARLFGFSKPIQIAPITRVRNHPVSGMSTVDDFDTSQKLTLTSKAELSIDPRLMEMEPEDVMSFKYLSQKETYLGKITWTPGTLSGTFFGSVQVDPMAERRDLVSGVTTIVPTSLSYISRPMRAWSGTLRYRIQAVASQYHRGRFAIVYAPIIAPTLTQEVFNNTYNMVIDLAEGRDFAFEVNWQQPEPYKNLNKDPSFDDAISETYTAPLSTSNGAFYFRAVNRLTVPDSTTPVVFLVSVSAGDDFEVANPAGSTNYYVWEPQSFVEDSSWEAQSAVEVLEKDENQPEATEYKQLTTGASDDVTNKNLVHFGETIVSARQLVKRYSFVRRVCHEIDNPSNINTCTYIFNMMPPEPGYNPDGFDRDSASTPVIYTAVPHLLYYKRLFAGWKGAIRWKVIPISGIQSMSVSRHPSSINSSFRVITQTVVTSGQSGSSTASQGLFSNNLTAAGLALTQNRTMDALEFEVPYKTKFKFSRASARYESVARNTDEAFLPAGKSVNLRIVPQVGATYLAFELYAAAGEDYQLMGCIGAPKIYDYVLPSPGLP